MEKLDGRKLDRSTLEAIRIRAVMRVEAGESPEVVIQALGFHRSQIYAWLAAYREGGLEALRQRKAKGREPKLRGGQLDRLYRLITEHNPTQLKFEFALWTRAMVRELIRREFKVRLSEVSVGRLLRTLGLSPQRPLHRAYQRDEAAVEHWQAVAYPEIRRLAKREKATIYFGDEASVRSDHHSGTSWAPIGQTPVIETTGARFGVNMISAVSPRGGLRFMTFTGTLTAPMFIDFLGRLIEGATTPVFLIVDGHPVHRSRKVRDFVDGTAGRLRLFILPAYSPHLNPDEWVWNWLKRHHLGKVRHSGPDQLRQTVTRFLRRLQRLTHIVKGFFQDKNLAYIHNNVG